MLLIFFESFAPCIYYWRFTAIFERIFCNGLKFKKQWGNTKNLIRVCEKQANLLREFPRYCIMQLLPWKCRMLTCVMFENLNANNLFLY